MDSISRIELFLAVVKHQSFSGAARHLGMSGPALSKQVQNLEDQLGVRLLHRTTRLVTLTEEGALYSARAQKAIEDLKEAEHHIQELKAHPIGNLRVNVPMSFGKRYLSTPIAEFARRYPDVQMDVDFDDRHVDVIREGYDVVIRIGSLADSSLIARTIKPCPIILCASPEYLKTHNTPQTPEELAHHQAIIFSKHGINTEWLSSHPNSGNHTIKLHPNFMTNNAEMICEACRHGIGIALLPIFIAAEHLQSGELVTLLPEYTTEPQRNIYAIFPQNRHLSTKVRLFVDHISNFSKTLPW